MSIVDSSSGTKILNCFEYFDKVAADMLEGMHVFHINSRTATLTSQSGVTFLLSWKDY